jgi:TonB family protein
VPQAFARQNISGRVEVSFKLDNAGQPRDIRVEKASHTEYAESVVNALRQWRFEDANATNVRYRLPVYFN